MLVLVVFLVLVMLLLILGAWSSSCSSCSSSCSSWSSSWSSCSSSRSGGLPHGRHAPPRARRGRHPHGPCREVLSLTPDESRSTAASIGKLPPLRAPLSTTEESIGVVLGAAFKVVSATVPFDSDQGREIDSPASSDSSPPPPQDPWAELKGRNSGSSSSASSGERDRDMRRWVERATKDVWISIH